MQFLAENKYLTSSDCITQGLHTEYYIVQYCTMMETFLLARVCWQGFCVTGVRKVVPSQSTRIYGPFHMSSVQPVLPSSSSHSCTLSLTRKSGGMATLSNMLVSMEDVLYKIHCWQSWNQDLCQTQHLKCFVSSQLLVVMGFWHLVILWISYIFHAKLYFYFAVLRNTLFG